LDLTTPGARPATALTDTAQVFPLGGTFVLCQVMSPGSARSANTLSLGPPEGNFKFRQ
jgi:hypothetical protein